MSTAPNTISTTATVSDRIRRDLDAGLTTSERVRLGLRIGTALCAGVLLAAAFAVGALFPPEQRPIAESLKAIAAILVLMPILKEAVRGVLTGATDAYSSQLVSVAALAALSVGDFVTAALVPIILSVAFFLEERSVLGAQAAIDGLRSLQARRARRVDVKGIEHEVDIEQLLTGDKIIVRAGETIPADGKVITGYSAIDQSSITGESTPEDVSPGSIVFGGTINHNGTLTIEVTSAGESSTLGKVLELLHEAEQSKTTILKLVEKYAKYFVLAVLLIAGITLFLSRDLSRAIAVLVVGCPGPFILAGPAAMVAALAAATRKGILVKNAKFLEVLTDVDSVIFDKTGTVTLGALEVTEVQGVDGRAADEVLKSAAICAYSSRHPVSTAIVQHAKDTFDDATPTADHAEEIAGRGVIAEWDGRRFYLGRRNWLIESGFNLPAAPNHSGPIVWLGEEFHGLREPVGCILLADHARPDAKLTIEKLHELGIERATLLTGDRREVAETIAEELSLDNVVPEVLPSHKLEVVKAERAAGYRVMVVGDGVNDAPALAGGDLGVAMGAAGAEVALRSADMVLMNEQLDRIPFAIHLARRTRKTIHWNVLVGAGLTLGMLGLASAGYISPIAGAFLQNLGEAYVIINSATLLHERTSNR
ncbi:heavy metal translocating P-type ATPase [Calycomorphotria hydatis]|uniref:P-type Zn(2+) transporter n=1 Tax=Calycomorphotria hydatis TaxID=2528027 RepID=A0A517TA21_9PLAN|nr:cation-translocating P-type ATPase [Calycomorphotria hydatis]QDT65209.1 Cadmium, zinc and cobalt-transporting ATPase [Calycomorphotria hydatis]